MSRRPDGAAMAFDLSARESGARCDYRGERGKPVAGLGVTRFRLAAVEVPAMSAWRH